MRYMKKKHIWPYVNYTLLQINMAQSRNSPIIIGGSLPYEFQQYSETMCWVLGKVHVRQVYIHNGSKLEPN
jgi:hypothetical protein